MLILTGEGSGVVMIEKSARGVRFALRTLGVARSDNMRAGIITRKAVFVRDLPSESDPSAVFFIDDADTENLHFAVFDAKLILYGTTAPARMWEANIMDLLNKYGAPVILPEKVLPTLPPVSVPPTVLPAPDGTGIPQSRLSIYGDDSLAAASDTYTTVDLASRMRVVDGFLDTPRAADSSLDALYSGRATLDGQDEIEREKSIPSAPETVSVQSAAAQEVKAIAHDEDQGEAGNTAQSASVTQASVQPDSTRPSALDGLAPRVMPSPDIPAYMLFPPDRDNAGTTATVDMPQDDSDLREQIEPATVGERDDATAEAASVSAPIDAISDAIGHAATSGESQSVSAAQKVDAVKSFVSSDAHTGAESFAMQTGRAKADEVGGADEACMPWELTAKWLKARSGREPVVFHDRVRTVKPRTDISALRQVAFFERCRADIEKLFSAAPRDEELSALLPDIDWVRVEVGGNVVGVGKSDNAFLCYAVPGVYEKSSPLGDEAQWLPKLKNAPTGRGYWLIFQDLISGEIIGN